MIEISFESGAGGTNNEALIEKLQPNRNLMQLRLYQYNGTEIPRWGRAQDNWAIILPNLVNIELIWCKRLHGIPLLSNLKYLKSFSLAMLNNMEYIETSATSRGGSRSKDLPFFPSLEYLTLAHLEKLKGWWGGVGEGDSSSGMPMPRWQPPFPRLSKLIIRSCPDLTSFPPCPSLESLRVMNSNKALRILTGEGPANLDLKLHVDVDNVGYLSTLPATHLTDVWIEDDDEVKSLSEFEEVFKTSSSLRELRIRSCKRLTSISRVLEHLTALESLSLNDIPVVDEEFDDDMPWRFLRHNLRSLKLQSLDTLQMLPRGMKHLTALHSLTIKSCPNLTSLGTIQNITSLQKLEILRCPFLREACKEPSGSEWPNIRHIPRISFPQW